LSTNYSECLNIGSSSLEIGELARKLTDARFDLNGSDSADVTSAFASGLPLATVNITDESGTQDLQARKTNVDKNQVGQDKGVPTIQSQARWMASTRSILTWPALEAEQT
jgi:hypothetical protein